MFCTLQTLAACFSLSGFYVDGSMMISNRPERYFQSVERDVLVYTAPSGFEAHYIHTEYTEFHKYQNPYGRLAIGYEVEFSSKFRARFDLAHESSVSTGQDRGFEKLTFAVTWRPFAR